MSAPRPPVLHTPYPYSEAPPPLMVREAEVPNGRPRRNVAQRDSLLEQFLDDNDAIFAELAK